MVLVEVMQEWKKDRILYQMTEVEKTSLYESFLQKYLTTAEVIEHTDELFNSKFWQNLVEMRKEKYKKYGRDLGMYSATLQILFSLIRKYKPKLLVETGVHFGLSTAVFLYAMKLNQQGKLISIDNWDSEECGCYVTKDIENRWELKTGKSMDILPNLNWKVIDFFCHDSAHTYTNMWDEYRWAIGRVKKGGLIISHDVGSSNAWFEFTKEFNLEWYLIKTAIKKAYATGVTFGIKEEVKEERKEIDSFF
jgi:predicted O-methyltransferase YrrM